MGEFEKHIQDIFENAEFQPSEQVWEGVERKLKSSKKRGIIINWQSYGIAAAVVLTLGFGYLFSDQIFTTSDNPAQTEEASEKKGPEQATDDPSKTNADETQEADKTEQLDSKIDQQNLAAITEENDTQTTPSRQNDQTAANPLSTLAELPEAKPEIREALVNFPDIALLDLKELRSVAYQLQWNNKYLVPAPDFGNDSLPYFEEKRKGMSLLGSLTSGSFNPESGSNLLQSDFNAIDQPNQFTEQELQDLANGIAIALQGDERVNSVYNSSVRQENSYSVGAGLNFDLKGRWGIRTGLQFSVYRFSSTSNAFFEEDGKRLPIYIPSGFNSEAVFLVEPYELTNSLSSVSIPVSLSYSFFNRGKYGVALMMGAGVDYMLSHKIESDLNILETRRVNFSENQAINRINLAGLTGLEFSYQLNEKFGLIAAAYYRKYITKSELSLSTKTNPAFYGFGLSVNYLLKP